MLNPDIRVGRTCRFSLSAEVAQETESQRRDELGRAELMGRKVEGDACLTSGLQYEFPDR